MTNQTTLVKCPVGRSLITNFSSNSTISEVVFATNKRTGVKNAGFRAAIAQHMSASTDYSRAEHHVVVPPIDILTTTNNGAYSQYTGFLPANLSPVIASTDIQTDNIAIGKLRNKLNNNLSQFKSLIPLGEIKETRNLINSVASASGKLLSDLTKIRSGRSNLNALVRDASDLWLTFSFGVSPTISDINSLVNAVGSVLSSNNRNLVFRGKASYTRTYAEGGPFVVGAASGCDIRYYPAQSTESYSVQYTAGVNIPRIQSGNVYQLGQHFGLTFRDLIPTFWELVPYTWIVDYFTTTGQFLEDTFSSPGVNTVYCTKAVTNKKVSYQGYSASPVNGSSFNLEHFSANQGFYEGFIYTRTALSNLPTRTFAFKSIDAIGKNSLNRLLNLASVFIGGHPVHRTLR